MFGALRQGAPFYVLTKGENPTLEIGQVESMTEPKLRYQTSCKSYGNLDDKIIEVAKVRIGDELVEFNSLPCNMSIYNYKGNSVIVSDSREAMSVEVENMIRNSQAVIDSVPLHEKAVEAGTKFLMDLNPRFAKEKQQEERIAGMEDRMGGIEDTLKNIEGMLASALSKKEK